MNDIEAIAMSRFLARTMTDDDLDEAIALAESTVETTRSLHQRDETGMMWRHALTDDIARLVELRRERYRRKAFSFGLVA